MADPPDPGADTQRLRLLPTGDPPPDALLRRTRVNIQRWTEMERGDHFAALEAPDALASDMAAYFRHSRQLGDNPPNHA